jgi:hypothetical protein
MNHPMKFDHWDRSSLKMPSKIRQTSVRMVGHDVQQNLQAKFLDHDVEQRAPADQDRRHNPFSFRSILSTRG